MSKELLVFLGPEPDYGLLSRAAELAAAGDTVVEAFFILPCNDCTDQSGTAACDAEKLNTADRGNRLSEAENTDVSKAFLYGADRVRILRAATSDEAALSEAILSILTGPENAIDPEMILAPATICFRAVLPYLAARLKAGLTADCIELRLNDEGRLLQVRPAMGNRLMAEILTTSPLQMATVREGVYLPSIHEKPPVPPVIHTADKAGDVRTVERITSNRVHLNQAAIIFAGGAGIGSREAFEAFEQAVSARGFAVGATRKAVELGYTAYAHQIGQTGVIVAPEVYVAFGISGSIQHLIGMRAAKKIIAVNTDKKAPIFDYADYGVYGDWRSTFETIMKHL